MFIKDDICYAGEPAEDMEIIQAKPLEGGMLLVQFSTGEKRLFDTTMLQGSAFEPLKEKAVFHNPQITHGFISWKDGEIDIAPETVYAESYPYTEASLA